MPFAPVIQAFRELSRSLDQDERARLEWCWPYELAFLGPIGPGTAGVARPSAHQHVGTGATVRVHPEHPRRARGDRAGPGCAPAVLLALEDLHWADRSTLDLISFLVRNLRDQRVLVVLTMRTDEPFRDDFVRDWTPSWCVWPRSPRSPWDG